jgi:hypothetical protein
VRYRQAKQNQPKDDRPETRESRILDLMALHKEDLVRRLVDADPVEVERMVADLRTSRDGHAAALEAVRADLIAQLAEAQKTIAFLRSCRAMQQKQNATLVQRLQTLERRDQTSDEEPQA